MAHKDVGSRSSRCFCLQEKRGPFFSDFVLLLFLFKELFVFQAFVAFVAFHVASFAFTVPLFSHPLHCQFRCGRWFFGFVAFGFSHPLLSQLVVGLGLQHPQHRKFLPFD